MLNHSTNQNAADPGWTILHKFKKAVSVSEATTVLSLLPRRHATLPKYPSRTAGDAKTPVPKEIYNLRPTGHPELWPSFELFPLPRKS